MNTIYIYIYIYTIYIILYAFLFENVTNINSKTRHLKFCYIFIFRFRFFTNLPENLQQRAFYLPLLREQMIKNGRDKKYEITLKN